MTTNGTPELFSLLRICRVKTLATDSSKAREPSEFAEVVPPAQAFGGRQPQVPLKLVEIDIAGFVGGRKTLLVQSKLFIAGRRDAN